MTTTLKRFRLAAIIGMTLLPFVGADAHDSAKGPNGGAMVQVDDKHLELTATSEALSVYVTDAKHDPVSTAGGTGRAIVQADGKTATIALAPVAPNVLAGKPEATFPKGTIVVVTATLPGGASVQSRFVVP
jgi:hypothetical protein